MNDEFFALHITWTCYGTWLPGDPRGYTSNTLTNESAYLPKQNTPGSPHTANDLRTFRMAQFNQKGETVALTQELAVVVCRSLVASAEQRGWRILRAAVMWNHVHVVVCDCPDDGPGVRRVLKGVSQSNLTKYTEQSRRWWTAGGSDRHKRTEEAALAAIQYDADQRGILAEIIDMVVQPRNSRPPG